MDTINLLIGGAINYSYVESLAKSDRYNYNLHFKKDSVWGDTLVLTPLAASDRSDKIHQLEINILKLTKTINQNLYTKPYTDKLKNLKNKHLLIKTKLEEELLKIDREELLETLNTLQNEINNLQLYLARRKKKSKQVIKICQIFRQSLRDISPDSLVLS